MLLFCLKIRVECLSTRTAAALFNMSYFGKFYLTGPDARKAVDWVFTNRYFFSFNTYMQINFYYTETITFYYLQKTPFPSTWKTRTSDLEI